MIKPLSGVERISRLLGIAEAPSVRPVPAVLAPATWRVALSPFEELLRETLHRLKSEVARVDAEAEPLVRHLGYRTLNRGLGDSPLDPAHLTRPDEQRFAQDLVDSVRSREAESLRALDDTARDELGVLLAFEQRLEDRRVAQRSHQDAVALRAGQRAMLEQLDADTARRRLDLAQLDAARRPVWQRALSLAIALGSCGALGVLLWKPALLDGLAAFRGVLLVAASILLPSGLWLAFEPTQRRAWLNARLRQLATWRQSATQREADARESLRHALKLFEEVDAQFQRDEVAARAVLLRLPGAQRYVRTSGAVIAFTHAPRS